MKLGTDISYVIIEALAKRHIKEGLMSTQCEQHVIYGVLAGLKTHMVGDNATPLVLIQTPKEALHAINLTHVNILSIDAYDGITREFCIFRAVEEDQKIAFEMIVDFISTFTTQKRMKPDNMMIDVDTFTNLPERFVKASEKENTKTVKKSTEVGGIGAVNNTKGTTQCGVVGGHKNVGCHVHNTGYQNNWVNQKPQARFFTRTSTAPTQSDIRRMLSKVKALQREVYEAPTLPDLPEKLPAGSTAVKHPTNAYGNRRSDEFYCY